MKMCHVGSLYFLIVQPQTLLLEDSPTPFVFVTSTSSLTLVRVERRSQGSIFEQVTCTRRQTGSKPSAQSLLWWRVSMCQICILRPYKCDKSWKYIWNIKINFFFFHLFNQSVAVSRYDDDRKLLHTHWSSDFHLLFIFSEFVLSCCQQNWSLSCCKSFKLKAFLWHNHSHSWHFFLMSNLCR